MRRFVGHAADHRAYLQVVTRAICLLLLAFCTEASAAEPADLFRSAASGSKLSVDHSIWDRLLSTYVKPGPDGLNRVDYAAFKEGGHGALKQYIAQLEAVDPERLNRAEQFAFLANLYNAKTIDIVIDHYPVRSIKDVSLGAGLLSTFSSGPWRAKVVTLNGVEFSLDDIEHGVLRALFKDPRVHYSVNCASVGCPNLQSRAFVGVMLDAQLDASARAYVNHTRAVTITQGKLVVSSIYEWFKADFGGNDQGVLAHLRKYAAPELKAKLQAFEKIGAHRYDWSLNDAR
ncbi:DUF547 domain-containing protein [Methylosinus sp. H3A]|uniref:DUF547 domain-containing protein n=1 Tax=Methylosinus sp. H3A TaxID=2785786 RepID=UPI0018C2648B|nr:DUF547 domain-containing protein [Methylosinus sp. H3A]MBG0808040.1 DUF547 domain-containing protein [Methylosinus sp. H3A]